MSMKKPKRLLHTEAIDHYVGNIIKWPHPEARLKFDFLFRRDTDDYWRYINSFDVINEGIINQAKTCIGAGGQWRVVAARTGYILMQGGDDGHSVPQSDS